MAECFFGRKVRNAAGNISEYALSLVNKRLGLHMKYLSDMSLENKKNIRK